VVRLAGKNEIPKKQMDDLAVLTTAIGVLTAFKLESKSAPQYFTESVQKGDIQNVVQATAPSTP